ncbi:MAG: hypothetical protein ACK559_29380, partial [bacterium]
MRSISPVMMSSPSFDSFSRSSARSRSSSCSCCTGRRWAQATREAASVQATAIRAAVRGMGGESRDGPLSLGKVRPATARPYNRRMAAKSTASTRPATSPAPAAPVDPET